MQFRTRLGHTQCHEPSDIPGAQRVTLLWYRLQVLTYLYNYILITECGILSDLSHKIPVYARQYT